MAFKIEAHDSEKKLIEKDDIVEVLKTHERLFKMGGYAFCEKGQQGKVKSIPNAKNVQVVFPGRENQPIGFDPKDLKVISST